MVVRRRNRRRRSPPPRLLPNLPRRLTTSPPVLIPINYLRAVALVGPVLYSAVFLLCLVDLLYLYIIVVSHANNRLSDDNVSIEDDNKYTERPTTM